MVRSRQDSQVTDEPGEIQLTSMSGDESLALHPVAIAAISHDHLPHSPGSERPSDPM